MSECEIAEFYSHCEPVAKKAHRCSECDAFILPGEKHFKATGKWDGRIDTNRQHFLCEKACEMVRDNGWNDDECLAYGELFVWWDSAKDDVWTFDDIRRHGDYKKFRSMLAQIKRRERESATSHAKGVL